MADDISLDENQTDVSVESPMEPGSGVKDLAMAPSIDAVNDENQVGKNDLVNEEEVTDLAIEQPSEEINELKKNLAKDLKIIDEALSDEEFLAKINSKNVFVRFEKYLRANVQTLNDFEAILKSIFLQFLLLIGIAGGVGLYYYAQGFYKDEKRKALIGYIKVNHKLPETYKGTIDPELKTLIEKYVLPHQKHEPVEQVLEEAPLTSTKYPGVITNPLLLMILEEQGVGKVTAKGTEYTEKINLSGLDLKSIDFKYLNRFIQSDLRQVDMRGVVIEQVQFRGAKLDGADMSQAVLKEGNFIRARMDHVKLRAAELTDANFYGAAGKNVLFESALLARANFKETSFLEVYFENAVAFDANFEKAQLQGANFMSADLRNANFKGANLTAANFRSANLEGANFKDAILDGANFGTANLLNTSLENASLSNAFLGEATNLTMEQLEAAQFAYNAETLPEWVNQRKLSWQRRF
jgi:uncharacterized protein YjbI with pentapeptide repeats